MEKIVAHDEFFVAFNSKDEYHNITKLFYPGGCADSTGYNCLNFQYSHVMKQYFVYLSDAHQAVQAKQLIGCPVFTYNEFMAIMSLKNKTHKAEQVVSSEDSEGDALMKFFAAEPGTWGGYSGV